MLIIKNKSEVLYLQLDNKVITLASTCPSAMTIRQQRMNSTGMGKGKSRLAICL